MSHQPDNPHHVRRVVLPSGRAIEVVYFESTPPGLPAGTESTAPPGVEDLHVCPECPQGLVYPLAWEAHDEASWEVALRCPNCEWSSVGVYRQDTVDRFDEELDRGATALLRDLKRLTRANMEEEIERFTRALAADAILPEDF